MSSPLQQDLENSLIRLKRDILILSIKKYQLSENIIQMVTAMDKHIPEMVDWVRKLFSAADLDKLMIAHDFHEFLIHVLQESLGVADLQDVIINDEIETVELVKNQFVELVRTVKNLIS